MRQLLKVFHPEASPGRVGHLQQISATGVFPEHYDRVRTTILTYCSTGRVLDIGPGCRLLIALHKTSPNMHLTGMDISSAMVGRARKNMETQGLRRAIPIRGGSASMIPFPDNTFDIVVSTAAIHHWKDPVRALNEVYRVLKGGRYALIYDVVRGTPSHIVEKCGTGSEGFGPLFSGYTYEEPFLNPSLDASPMILFLKKHEIDSSHFLLLDFEEEIPTLWRKTVTKKGIGGALPHLRVRKRRNRRPSSAVDTARL